MKLLNEYEYKIPKIWFYVIKGVNDVATLKELEIAKQMTEVRAKNFLETRAYLRRSLSTLFEIDPLKIPIDANPGKPPKLPSGMGNVSLSHCKDAIVIVWHKNKIGIDIERKDRNFKYKRLAEKYFFNTNKSKDKNIHSKDMILNQWCTIEAAIKWDQGSIAKDIHQWQFYENEKDIIHSKKNLHLKFSLINFHEWTIALAYAEKTAWHSEIICCSKNF